MLPKVVIKKERRDGVQVARTVAVNDTHRLPDALAPLTNVRRGAEGDKQTPNVTKRSR